MKQMFYLNIANYVLLAIVLSVLAYYSLLIYATFFLIVIALIFFLDEEIIIPSFIVLFLILVSDLVQDYRAYLNLILIISLFYYYIKKFGISSKSIPSIPREIYLSVLFVLISMFFSSIFSENIGYALLVTARQSVFFIIVYILFAFITSERVIFNYITALLITAIVLGIALVYQALTTGLAVFSLSTHSVNNFSGLYENANALGLFFTVVIPLTIGMVLIKRDEKTLTKYIYYFLSFFFIIVLFLTNSRSSVGAVFISSLYIFGKLKPVYLKYIFHTLLSIVIVIILVPILNEYVSLYFRVERIFENTRYFIWDMTFNIIKNNYWLGVGPGLFETKIYTYLPVMRGSFEEFQIWWAKGGTAHNIFLFKFAETGIFGLISIIYLYITFFKIAFVTEKLSKTIGDNFYLLSVVISGVGLGMFFHSFLETNGIITNGWITRDLPFWILFIIAIYFHQAVLKNVNTEK